MKKILSLIIFAIMVTGCATENRNPTPVRIEHTPEPTPEITVQPTEVELVAETCYAELSNAIEKYLQFRNSPEEMYEIARTCEDKLIYHRLAIGVKLEEDNVLEKYIKD